MNLPTISLIKNIVLLVVFSITSVALVGCGNKGPLVRPSDIPAPVPAASTARPAAAEPAADPDVPLVAEPASGTPAAQR